MKIVLISEIKSQEKIDDSERNMRTDLTFCKLLDAFHISYQEIFNPTGKYTKIIESADFAVMIPSKKHPQVLKTAFLLRDKKIPFGILQEGPNTYWQTWPTTYQVMYLAIIQKLASVVFCHNEYDKKYFEGLTKKPVIVDTTVHYTDFFDEIRMEPSEKKNTVFIGGNLTPWYNGMTSYMVANNIAVDAIAFPSMGQKQDDEEDIMERLDPRVVYYPYMKWVEYMKCLNQYKVGVHLMKEVAAGSFNLNCAILGIPCIGNKNEDVQKTCFPDLAVDVNDVKKARELLERLLADEDFYNKVRDKALKEVKNFHIDYQRNIILKELEQVLQNEKEN